MLLLITYCKLQKEMLDLKFDLLPNQFKLKSIYRMRLMA
jgi:hypothetical protein